MPAKHNLVGRTFGKWYVIDYYGQAKNGAWKYLCRCKCGTERALVGHEIEYGNSKSCGCANETIQERFEKYYVKGAENECWEWARYKDKRGYGTFRCGKKKIYAPRFSWTLYVGEIPDGLFVCHKCDNPGCVNPAHLFLGTHLDNMQDCANKGRRPKQDGEKNNAAKLMEVQVKAIREMRRDGVWEYVIAKEFGVTQSTVSMIVNNKTWRMV